MPLGWALTPIESTIPHDGVFSDGDWVESKDQDPNGEVRLIQLADVGDGVFHSRSARFLTSEKATELRCTYLRKGDILIARMPDPLGRACVFPLGADQRFVTVVDVCVVRTNQEQVDRTYLCHVINFLGVRKQVEDLQTGTTRKRISRRNLATVQIPLAPIGEQRRIAAKIDELFSELEAGIESLKKARAKLATYRQAVLKHAFEGTLTAQWRDENKDRVETPEQLLTRVKKELVERYEQQLREWKSAVKMWEKNGDRDKKPLEPRNRPSVWNVDAGDTNLDESFDFPDSWIIVRYGEICSVVRNGTSAKPSGTSGYRIARISAVRPMAFDYDDYRLLQCDEVLANNYTLQANDLVFTRYNGSRRFVGVCARFDGREERLFPDKLIQTRPDLPCLSSRFLEAALNVGLSRAFLETKIRTTAGQSGISGSDIRTTPIPVTSLPEQQEVVFRLGKAFEAIERTERTVAEALQQANSVRHAILKRAFSGQLMPQDPNDEPASILLDRIRAEREQVTKHAIHRTGGKRRVAKATA